MRKFVREISSIVVKQRRNRPGQVLPVVLVLLMFGGLMIAPSLDFVSTGLRSRSIVERQVQELYAADAGVEHGLWKLRNDPPTSYPHTYQLADVNGMPVTVTMSLSNVLWGFTVGSGGEHSSTLLLHAAMTWDAQQANYLYIITITNTNISGVHLNYIMVTPPTGYSYKTGSSSGLTTANPQAAGDPNGNVGLMWDFDTPRPAIPPAPNPGMGVYSSVSQNMRLEGEPGYGGAAGYLWVSAERQDIGTVSTAAAMKITSHAMRGEETAASATALVLVDVETGSILVGSWQIN